MSQKPAIIIDLLFNQDNVRAGLKGAFRGREVINRADPENRDRDLSAAHYALLWKPKDDLFQRATGLKALFSGGAGVDHVLTLPDLPDLPLVRFVDPSLTNRMSEWVVMQCLMHLRQHVTYSRQHARKLWSPLNQPEASDLTVGVMGMGVLGLDSAIKLKMMGFNVLGWSRTKKVVDGIETFEASELDAFLGKCDMLVGLLPLTDATTGIFNAELFAKLRRGGALGAPVFINAGRGKSQVEADIIASIEKGVLKGASLDVFETEPLPASSKLWAMDSVLITPHTASDSEASALFAHVERQIERFEAGQPLEHLVSRDTGY
ncbi:2-hydroxyacid dehydrogenase [Rhizobium sp.]